MLKLWFWMQITILCISANLCFGMVIILGCSCGWIVSDPISLCTFIDRRSESHIFTISLARFSPCYEMPVGLPLALSPHFLVEMLFRVCRRLKTYVSNKGHFPNPIPLSVTSPCMSATPREVILSIKTEGINIQVNYGTHAPQWVANCCHKQKGSCGGPLPSLQAQTDLYFSGYSLLHTSAFNVAASILQHLTQNI